MDVGPHDTYQLAIIGAGQLGSRHLQALARLAYPCEINVVDPIPAALDLARQRFIEMPPNSAVRTVRYHASIDALPRKLDYVIIATTADVRLSVMQALLLHASVRWMLLEKVLFQRLTDYQSAQELLSAHHVRAWVNCPRRCWSIYSELREFFQLDPLRYFQVMGGGWGLGCNSVHFLDLLGLLTRSVPTLVSTVSLDAALTPSKRKGYIEFTGSICGEYRGGARFEMTSLLDSSARLLLTLHSETRTAVIDEAGGCAFLLDTHGGRSWTRREFQSPLLSQLGTSVAADILTTGNTLLATFEQSTAYHIPLIEALSAHAAMASGTPPDFCPIT